MSRIYPERPIVGIGVVVWHQDAVLLVRRSKPPRQNEWSLPGGAQKVGESVFEAAIREVREETTLDIKVLGLVDVVDSIRRDDKGCVRYHFTLIDLFADWISGTAAAQDDAAEVAWVNRDEIDRYGLWLETVRVIHLAHEKRLALDQT